MEAETSKLVLYLLQVVVGGFCGVLWFLYQDLKKKADGTAKELANYRVHIAETYVTQNELTKAIDALNRAVDAIFNKLDRIDNKLDNKQDKIAIHERG